MSHIIIIREYRQSDEIAVKEIVKQSLLSLTRESFISTLINEITFQLIVMTAAIMFIFIGLPFLYCISSIPVVIGCLYICIYINLIFKSIEAFQEKPYQCWVAEAFEPYYFTRSPQKFTYAIYSEYDIKEKKLDLKSLQSKVIGTVALKKHRFAENSSWLYRLAVDSSYRHKGIGTALVHSTIKWSKIRGFHSLEVAVTEHQDAARCFFMKTGFHLRQMYHKQIIGSAMTLLKYQFGLELSNKHE